MTGCEACGRTAEFVFECPACGERFCAEHIDPKYHDCPETEGAGSGAHSLRTVVGSFLVVGGVILLIVATLLAFRPGGPLGLDTGADASQATTTAAPDRVVIQAINDVRDEANRSPLGYYGPLADLAADRDWDPQPSSESEQVDGSLTCQELSTLTYSTGSPAGDPSRLADQAVESWMGNSSSRTMLLDRGIDLAGGAYDSQDGSTWVRVVVCNSTG